MNWMDGNPFTCADYGVSRVCDIPGIEEGMQFESTGGGSSVYPKGQVHTVIRSDNSLFHLTSLEGYATGKSGEWTLVGAKPKKSRFGSWVQRMETDYDTVV